jgi:hypothetical protein
MVTSLVNASARWRIRAFFQEAYPFAPHVSLAKTLNAHCGTNLSSQAPKTLKPITPCAVVLFDMLTSPTPGLIAQMTKTSTYRRYLHAAVYVDQATGYGFIWLQKSLSEE